MAYQRWWKTVRDQQGNAVNGASVAVYNGGTGTLALVYDPNSDDASPSNLSNPFVTTANGVFGFMAADGEYDVQISGGAFATQQFRVVLNGFVSGSAATLAADLAATTGAGLVGTPAGTVQSKLDSLTTATSTTIPAAFAAADAVVTAAFQAADTALDTRLDAVEVGQSSAVVGYDTQANLYSNLVPADKSVAYVMNDSTPAKNGTYRKVGGTGTGSWVQSSYDRVALVEAQAAATEVSWIGDGIRNFSYLKKLSAEDSVLRRTDWQGTWDLSSATRRIINKYSEPLLANFYSKSGTLTQGALTDHGLSNGAGFPAASQQDYGYLATADPITSGTPYTATIFVKMADLSKPRVGDNTSSAFDMVMVLGGSWLSQSLPYVYTDLGGGLWRVDVVTSVTVATQTFGVLRLATQSGKAFTVTGFYLTAGSTVTPYIKNGTASYLDVADYSIAADGRVTTANTPETGAATYWVSTKYAGASALVAVDQRVSVLESQVSGVAVLDTSTPANNYIQVPLGGSVLKIGITPFKTSTHLNSTVFNFSSTYVDGVAIHNTVDDVAPYRAYGTTIGANHGYAQTYCTMTSHGKTNVDVGSIYQDGAAKQWVICDIPDLNTIAVTARSDNASFTGGTLTHVSGGTNTAAIVTSGVVQNQWYPVIKNRSMTITADDRPIPAATGTVRFNDYISFNENYEIMNKSSIVEWLITQVGTATPIVNYSGTSDISVSMSYVFDIYGGCTIYTDLLALNAVSTLSDIMFTDSFVFTSGVDGAIKYYIPKTLPLTHETINYDFSKIVDMTSFAPTTRLDFDPATRCVATGQLADRVVQLGNTNAMAIGYLPVQDADPAVRRTRAARKAMQLSEVKKIYMSCVDSAAIASLAPGDYYSAACYRTYFKRPTGRTAQYMVRDKGSDYLYLDWHVTTVDRVSLPPHLVGRDYTVVEKSANVSVLSAHSTGSLVFSVTAAGSYGYAVLRF